MRVNSIYSIIGLCKSLSLAMMGTVCNDYMSINPYATIDSNRTSTYRSTPISNYTSMHSTSFFSTFSDPNNTFLSSTHYGISTSPYHGL